MNNLSTNAPPADLRALLKSDKVKEQIALALPRHMDADRMARVALTACNKTPNLLQCDTGSVLTALMICSACGIEPDGRNAHLIPFGKQCQLIIDWKGYVILAKRNGIKNIAGDVVCENDVFQWKRDENGLHFNHEIDLKKPRGAMYAAYVIWNEPSGGFDGEVMQRDQIDDIRKRSRASGSGPWVTDFNEMAKKTVVRRASKKWDITPEIREAIEKDDEQFERDVTPANGTARPKFLDRATEPEAPATNQPPEEEPVSTEEPPADDQRNGLLDSITDAREADGVSVKKVRDWAFRNKLCESAALALKEYPVESLRAVLERWQEVKA